MTRQTHDIINDHFPSGSPSDGEVLTYDSGSGGFVWSAGGGGSSVHLENDDTTFSDPAIVFTDGANTLAADGSTATDYGALVLDTTFAEIYAQDGSTFADVSASATSGRVEITATNGMLLPTLPAAPSAPGEGQAFWNLSTHSFQVWDGSSWTDSASAVIVAGATSTQTRFAPGRTVLYDENDEAYLNLDGDIDQAAYTGNRWSAGVNNGDPATDSSSWHTLYGGSGLKFPDLAADPTSPFENLTYYNTTTHKLRTYDGSSWHDLW